jgi:proteasome accessory factor B
MSKKIFFQRTKSIVKKLSTVKSASFQEISDYIEREYYALDFDDEQEFSYSLRTFQRDLKEIEKVWGIYIIYDRSLKGYCIDTEAGVPTQQQKLFEVYETMNALQLADDLKNVMFFENRQPSNVHYFEDIITAIKKRTLLEIYYKKFGKEKGESIKIAPYGLKEYNNRWYIIAKHNDKLRIYGLDRIEDLKRTADKYVVDESLNIAQLFQYSFGIFVSEDLPIEKVVLEVKKYNIPYLESLPLHATQVLEYQENGNALLKLQLRLTEDFVKELQSYGESIKVIAPNSLKKRLVDRLQKALLQYQ